MILSFKPEGGNNMFGFIFAFLMMIYCAVVYLLTRQHIVGFCFIINLILVITYIVNLLL